MRIEVMSSPFSSIGLLIKTGERPVAASHPATTGRFSCVSSMFPFRMDFKFIMTGLLCP
jgi:hypothetical protein